MERAPVNKKLDKKNKKSKKEFDAYERHLDAIESLKKVAPAIFVDHNKDRSKVRDLHLDMIDITIGGKVLLEESSLKLTYGHKYGLMGRNGIGKSCLMTAIARREFDKFPEGLQIFFVEQEVVADDKPVIQHVLETDIERETLLKEESELSGDPEAHGVRLNEINNRLEEIDAFSAEARAATILNGLGFAQDELTKPMKEFSGGWRMRVSLARALFANPDILLLDEPTNHLDLEAVMWLEDYLVDWPNTVLIVSHAREFLNNVCTDIYHFKDKKLTYYKGDYSSFEKKVTEMTILRRRTAQAQKLKLEHVQKFIDRFRANAARAAMVQSRIKTLNKMELVEEILEDPTCIFNFPIPEEMAPPLLKIQDGSFGYCSDKQILKDIQFGIDMGSRIALVGANGCGKTTLLKLLNGDIELTAGEQSRNGRLRTSMFTQHFVDQLDLKLSPVEQFLKDYPGLKAEEVRGHLGSFGITGEMGMKPHYLLSGGQKSRVAFALSLWKNPHIVILDEPTNHLDMEAVNALILGLNNYEGGILIVSHDQHLIQSVCDEIWYVKDQKVRKFKGDFDDYRKMLADGRL